MSQQRAEMVERCQGPVDDQVVHRHDVGQQGREEEGDPVIAHRLGAAGENEQPENHQENRRAGEPSAPATGRYQLQ